MESATLFPKGREMKALGIAAATVVALAPLSLAVATPPDVAWAGPCVGVFANPTSCDNCLHLVEAYHTANVCDQAQPARPPQVAPSRVPVQIPEPPPLPALPEPALQEPALPEPAPPSTIPVQSPPPHVVPSIPPTSSAIAAHEEPARRAQPWWPSALGYGALAVAVGVVAWMISRGNRART